MLESQAAMHAHPHSRLVQVCGIMLLATLVNGQEALYDAMTLRLLDTPICATLAWALTATSQAPPPSQPPAEGSDADAAGEGNVGGGGSGGSTSGNDFTAEEGEAQGEVQAGVALRSSALWGTASSDVTASDDGGRYGADVEEADPEPEAESLDEAEYTEATAALVSSINTTLFGADLQGSEHEWVAAALVCARCMLRRWSPHVAQHVAVRLARGNVVGPSLPETQAHQFALDSPAAYPSHRTPPMGSTVADDKGLWGGGHRLLLWRALWVGAALPLIALSIGRLQRR